MFSFTKKKLSEKHEGIQIQVQMNWRPTGVNSSVRPGTWAGPRSLSAKRKCSFNYYINVYFFLQCNIKWRQKKGEAGIKAG